MEYRAGALRSSIVIQRFACEGDAYQWVPVRRSWAEVKADGVKNLFSRVGIGARTVKLVLRAQALTLHESILCDGQHLILTDIGKTHEGWLDVTAAVVTPVPCRGRRMRAEIAWGSGNRPTLTETAVTFPGVLTEKYTGYTREDTHAEATATLVLVVPAAILLDEGDLVDALEGPAEETYVVTACHRLDPYRSEYELNLRKDV